MADLDPTVVNLAKAIRQQESGGDFTIKGKSGEYGGYQFTPDTWNGTAPKYGIKVPIQQATPEQQNAVAYNQIKAWKDEGKDVTQIASMWNAGQGEPDAYTGKFSTGKPSTGTNSFGVKYDVPSYVKAVANNYLTYKNQNTSPTDLSSPTTPPASSTSPTIDNTQPPTDQNPDLINKIGNVTDKATGLFGMNPLLKGLGQTISNTTGGTDAIEQANEQTRKISQSLIDKIKQDKLTGKDTSKLETALSSLKEYGANGEITDLGTQGITTKDVVGSAISTAATFLPGASAGASLLTKVLAGGATGYALDVGNNLQNKNKTLGQDFTPGLGTAVGAILPFAGTLISSLTKKIAGFTSGTGEEVIQRAIDNPDAVGDAVSNYAKNPEQKQDLVDRALTAVQSFVKQKGKEFGEAIDNMAVKEGSQISKQPVLDSLKNSFEDFGISEKGGQLDFANSSLTKEAESTLKQVFDKINNWKDETPAGLDSLRQYLKGEMGNYKVQGSSKVDAILNDAMKGIRTHLSENIPGYSNTLQNFSEKSQTTSELLKELGLGGVAKPSTKLANILKIFKKDPSVLDNLYKVMGKKEAETFLNDVAGSILSEWIPAGKIGGAMRAAGELGLGVGAHALGLGAAPAIGAVGAGAALASPRVVGAAARAASSRVAGAAGTAIERGLTSESSQFNP